DLKLEVRGVEAERDEHVGGLVERVLALRCGTEVTLLALPVRGAEPGVLARVGEVEGRRAVPVQGRDGLARLVVAEDERAVVLAHLPRGAERTREPLESLRGVRRGPVVAVRGRRRLRGRQTRG